MAGASSWAKGRIGGPAKGEEPEADSASADSDDPTSYSSASSDSYEDDKFHLPADHRPFVLLDGWDRPPEPPPMPDTGSESESGSESEDDEGGSESGKGSPEQPPAPPPRQPGFSCQDCAFFKALGNGTFGCESSDYRRWAGTDKLAETKSGRPVVNPEKACSDWFQPAQASSGRKVPTRHNAEKP